MVPSSVLEVRQGNFAKVTDANFSTNFLSEETRVFLIDCLWQILNLAKKHGIKIISLPSILAEVNGFSKKQEATLVIEAVKIYLEFYSNGIEKIIFAVSNERDRKIYESILNG